MSLLIYLCCLSVQLHQYTHCLFPQIKTRAKGVQTVQLERPTPDEHVTKNQTGLDDSFDADFERVFNTKEIDTLADTLGLPSLPATIR